MSRRVLGITAAVLLAAIGTVLLVAYVSGAEERALEGEERMEVYVVNQTIPAGTTGDEIEALVAVEEVPAKVRPINAVTNLNALTGRVAAVDLPVGEQLIESRFIAPAEYANRQAGVKVPEDLLEVTISLDPERAIGGLLDPGQTVAVLASFEPFDLATVPIDVQGNIVTVPEDLAEDLNIKTPNTTDTLVRKALVTAVQRVEGSSGGLGGGDDEEDGADQRLTTAPRDQILVTLALEPDLVERVVFAAEYGSVWLAIDRETVPDLQDSIKDRGNVYTQLDGFGADAPTDETPRLAAVSGRGATGETADEATDQATGEATDEGSDQ